MSTQTKAVTFPYAIKTIAVTTTTCLPYTVSTPGANSVFYAVEMALLIYPPLYTYAPTGLYMHLKYTFASTLATQYQQINRIYVRDTPSSNISSSGSTVEKYMDVNWVADANGTIEKSIDLTSLLTGKSTNVVFLRFPIGANPGWSGIRNLDTINLWKLDLIYQTIGIRDEK